MQGSKRIKKRRDDKKASILIVAAWILVFLTFLGWALYSMFSAKAKIVQFIQSRALSELAAYSACRHAQLEMRVDTGNYISAALLAGTQNKTQGLWEFSYDRIDEESKININAASAEIIGRLPGLDLEIASRITASTLRPLRLKEELLLIEGMTPELYDRIKDSITVYGTGAVNINTASPEVLRALGMAPALIDKILAFRNGPDGERASDDDGVFEDQAQIIKSVEAYSGLTFAEKNMLLVLASQQLLGVFSENYSLQIKTGSLHRMLRRYQVILNKHSILQWKEF